MGVSIITNKTTARGFGYLFFFIDRLNVLYSGEDKQSFLEDFLVELYLSFTEMGMEAKGHLALITDALYFFIKGQEHKVLREGCHRILGQQNLPQWLLTIKSHCGVAEGIVGKAQQGYTVESCKELLTNRKKGDERVVFKHLARKEDQGESLLLADWPNANPFLGEHRIFDALGLCLLHGLISIEYPGPAILPELVKGSSVYKTFCYKLTVRGKALAEELEAYMYRGELFNLRRGIN